MAKKKKRRAVRAKVVNETALGVQEASGIVRIADDTFLVVDDEQGIFRCTIGDDPILLDAGKGMADLEGICATPDLSSAYVLSERDGSVWRFAIKQGDLSDGERLGTLPRLSNKKNNGWEGIAFYNNEILAAHQVKPRHIGFFDPKTLKPRIMPRLPKDARKAIGELNDLAADPEGDRIFVLSGRAGRIGELQLDGEELMLRAVHAVDTSKRDVPEGLTWADGKLWLCTDGEGLLRELEI